MLLSSLISALLTWASIWLLTRKEADVSLKPVLMICVGITLVNYATFKFLGIWGPVVAVILLIFCLRQWCYLNFLQAILVSGVWLLSQVGYGLIVGPVF